MRLCAFIVHMTATPQGAISSVRSLQLFLCIVLIRRSAAFVVRTSVQATQTITSTSKPNAKQSSARYSALGDLWQEIIKFSTLGPGERRLLKARRSAKQREKDSIDIESFQAMQRKRRMTKTLSSEEVETELQFSVDEMDLSLEAFQAVAATVETNVNEQDSSDLNEFDGYALCDLLVERWGVPLDVDFSRQSPGAVYCSVLPVVAF
jgi:hypothetical protein